MTGISDIPVEVFEQICSQLRCNDDELNGKEWIACQSTLLSICRVSKAFHKLAKPYLYRQIFIVANNCRDAKFFSLVRALVSQPTLSQQVQSLRISYAQTYCSDNRNWRDYKQYRTPCSIENWDFLTNAVKDRLPWFTFIPRDTIWETAKITVNEIGLRNFKIECALQNLLYAHLPNLSTLHFSIRVLEGRPLSGWRADISQTRGCNDFVLCVREHLQQVKKLFIYGEDAQTPLRLSGMLLYSLSMPSTVTDLCLRNCELILADAGGSFFPKTWSTKKVSLIDCTMTPDVLSELTNDVFPLEEFEYVVNSKFEDKITLVTAAETIDRLKSYSASLVNLRLRFRLSDGKPIRKNEEPYKPSDFCDFKKLKTLIVHLADFGFHDNPNSTVPAVSTLGFPKGIQDLRVNEVL
ncbi:hypothetical protein CMEL01_08725 [Colletotrichum melonis]|uniref:F-box domain-containing protein n=1 Tax=Colletotrichum melonis TaxID=1209925 RepID=A0AAI9U331_9PEZI|nr:hypothetical protein CMEL01_08725 [Colletotrichum melonis]